MTAGQSFVKMIRPFGAALFLIIFIIFLVFAFSSGREPISDYEPPYGSDYYAENLGALESELEENVLPFLDGVVDCYQSVDTVAVVIEDSSFIKTRAALLRYFDESLFELIRS